MIPARDRDGEGAERSLGETTKPPTGGQGASDVTNRSETTGPGASAEVGKGVRRVRASDVLGPRGIVQIEHEGEIYTLRVTRNNRLILTK